MSFMVRGSTSAANTSARIIHDLPTLNRKSSGVVKKGKGQRLTLTSKHNWWLTDVEENDSVPVTPTARTPITDRLPVDVSPPQFTPPPHPSSIFGHLTPTSAFSSSATAFPFPAPQNPTSRLMPIATGSTSELFKCVVKRPDIMQIEINGEVQTNSPDVTIQFLAELRVYTTLLGHRNFPTYLGALDGIGMVLEFIEGRSLLDVLKSRQSVGGLDRCTKIDFHDQLVDGLTYLHSFGLSHGDLSLLNILVTPANTLKIIDFGRSTSITSEFVQPSESPPEPDTPFVPSPRPMMSRSTTLVAPHPATSSQSYQTINLEFSHPATSSHASTPRPRKVEQVHPGTRPFCAPEVLRATCADPILADAYSFGMLLYCVDLGGLVDVNQGAQLRGEIPDLSGCEVFSERIYGYLREPPERRRVSRNDLMGRSAVMN